MTTCTLLLLAAAAVFSSHATVQDGGPLAAADVTVCLRRLKQAEQPVLADAVACVKELTALAQTRQGLPRLALENLAAMIRNLFQKEQEMAVAHAAAAKLDAQSAKKVTNAVQAETVGSPLTGPNPAMGAMYRKDALDLREKAKVMMDRAGKVVMAQIVATNQAVAAYERMGSTEVVIALAGSMFAVLDRAFPGTEFQPAVSREWVKQQKLNP